MDWDEELKRQAAISALLAPPEAGSAPLDTQTDEQVTAQPDVIKPNDKSDYRKWVDSVFDTKTDDHPNISPPPPLNIPTPIPESPGASDLKTDEDTGTRYVEERGN